MAKLILFTTLICLQVLRLAASPVEVPQNTQVSVQNTPQVGVQIGGWTEQDKTWLQQLMQLLKNNEKEWAEKENGLLKDIIQKWFIEIENWFEDDDDEDDDWWADSEEWLEDSEWKSDESDYFNDSEEESINVTVNGNNDLNMEVPTVGLSNKFKRFSSI